MGAVARVRRAGGLAAGAGLVLMSASVLLAQDVPPRLVFDLGSSLTYDDNPDLAPGGSEPRLSFDTRLGLTLNSTTRDQGLSAGLSGLARLEGEHLTLRDPTATLSYGLIGANSRLSVNLDYRQSDVDLFEPQPQADGTLSTTDLLATDGTVTSQSARLSFATGLEGPLGLDLVASVSARDYSVTTDPDVYDSTSNSLSLGVHLRTPAAGRDISLTASRSASDYDDAAQTTRESQGLTLGVTQTLRPDLTLQASLGQSTASSRAGGVVTSESTGLTGSVGLQATLPNGTAGVSLSSARDAVGTRETLRVTRSMDLPTGALGAELALTSRAGQEGQVIGRLTYGIAMPTDRFDVSLSREVTLNTDNQDVANTVLGLEYQHQITEQSRLGLSLDLTDTGSGGSAGVDGSLRQTVTASYSQDLTTDWQLTAGYQFRSLDSTTADRADANSLYLTISRKFTLRP
jgi:hypothetical protein